jgi:hypothetical protein
MWHQVTALGSEGAFGVAHKPGWGIGMAVKSLRPELAGEPRHHLVTEHGKKSKFPR